MGAGRIDTEAGTMKIVIVGGVAAGAGAAARLRRLDEQAQIVLLERGPYISYANCGLPYHVGGIIPERDALLVMTPEKFAAWFNVDVRTEHDVQAIDRQAKTVTVRTRGGQTIVESYDQLVLATGSSPVTIPLPGSDDPRVMRLWTIPDMDAILARVKGGAKRAIVVGAGFIGLETAENLRDRGLDVTIVELCDQVLPTLDREMATFLSSELAAAGIAQKLGRRVVAFVPTDDAVETVLDDGSRLPADLVIMSVGVKPNSELAGAAGLALGPRGHIRVDEHLRTSDPAIYAAGDAVEVSDPVSGGQTAIPLAGPANRQARIVAENIVGRSSRYGGSYGTAILKLFGLTAAGVGLTERRLKQLALPYEKVYLHPASNAKYYPGGAQMHLKLLFAPDGKILGAQIVGHKGVDKRIDTIAVAMRGGLNVRELAELELAYAPPFNSAKDPVNFAGMVAANVLDGDSRIAHADALPDHALLIDVREEAELAVGAIPGALHLPMSQFRKRLAEIDRQRPVVTVCQVGLRAYIAERMLRQQGFDARTLSGGFITWRQFHPAPVAAAARPAPPTAAAPAPVPAGAVPQLDVRAMACPGPVVKLKLQMDAMAGGDSVRLLAPLSFEADLASWIAASGHTLVALDKQAGHLEAVIRKCGHTPPAEAAPAAAAGGHSAAIVLFSNDLDKALAALILACGLAASGAKVGIFFTFWGLSVLRRNPAPATRKTLMARMFGMMLPKGATRLALSKMHMGGMGTVMMKQVMAAQHVPSLPELLRQARELGVKFIACDMAMGVMGITRDELIEVDEVAGVAGFVEMARQSNNTLFI